MIHLLQPTETGILDNRPVGERNPTLPRIIKCENPHEVIALIEEFYQNRDELDETNKEIVDKTRAIFYHLDALVAVLGQTALSEDVKVHLDQIRDAAGKLFSMGDV